MEKLAGLGAELLKLDYEWLYANFPDLTDQLQSAIALGATPDEVRRFVMRLNGRTELATRMWNAARYVESSFYESSASGRA